MQLRPGTPQEAGMSAARVAHIKQLAANWVAQGETTALVVLAARRGIIVLHEAFGQLTPDADAPILQRDALYPLASLSKPVTATAVMILVEDGLLSLNRPVVEYIPEFSGKGKETVLVHHLLTHTSGLKEDDVNRTIDERKRACVPVPAATSVQDPRVNELLFYGYDVPLWKPPGVEMSYCSYGFDLLGEIIQRISGKSLASFAQERIFTPLGMEDTTYSVPGSQRHRIVKRPSTALLAGAQSAGWEGMSVYPLRGPALAWFDGIDSREWEELASGAGGVYSTALDIAKLGQMFLNGGRYGSERILSRSAIEAMTRNQVPGVSASMDGHFFPEAGWGLGWDIFDNKKTADYGSLSLQGTYGHGGGGGVWLWVDPVNEIVGVYFSILLSEYPGGRARWSVDLFMNVVTSAVDDE